MRQAKGVLAIWREKGLSVSETEALRQLIAKGNAQTENICRILKDKQKLLESVSEPEMQLIASLDEWTAVQKPKSLISDFEEFQRIHEKAIDSLCAQLRVRDVHFRTKKAKQSSQNIHSVVGFDSKSDAQIEVVKIPK